MDRPISFALYCCFDIPCYVRALGTQLRPLSYIHLDLVSGSILKHRKFKHAGFLLQLLHGSLLSRGLCVTPSCGTGSPPRKNWLLPPPCLYLHQLCVSYSVALHRLSRLCPFRCYHDSPGRLLQREISGWREVFLLVLLLAIHLDKLLSILHVSALALNIPVLPLQAWAWHLSLLNTCRVPVPAALCWELWFYFPT